MLWNLLTDTKVEDRVRRLELPFNRYGYDHFGISQKHLSTFYSLLDRLYHNYFQVSVHGIDNVPPRGRAMIICNHSGGIAFDAAMISAAVFFEKNPPRLAQGMAEKFMNNVPFTAPWTYRAGHFTGLPENAIRLLNNDRLLMVFPEGARGTAKLYKERNSLVRFGTGFMRLALQTNSPIVPTAFLGGGDIFPTVANLYTLGKLVGAPYIPLVRHILPIPLPAKCELYFGEPMVFEGDGKEDDDIIEGYVSKVREKINGMLAHGCRNRQMSEADMLSSGWKPTTEQLEQGKQADTSES